MTMADVWRSSARVYVNLNDEVVSETSPDVALLLVGENGCLPTAEAIRYGLMPDPNAIDDEVLDEIVDDEVDANAKSLDAAPENKAVSGPPTKK